MADFCYQCTERLYGERLGGRNDFVLEAPTKELRPVLCEGCGNTHVDWMGKCQHHHGSDECWCGHNPQEVQG